MLAPNLFDLRRGLVRLVAEELLLLLLPLPAPLLRLGSGAPTMQIAPFVPEMRFFLPRPDAASSSIMACRFRSHSCRASSWASRSACFLSAICFPFSSPLSFAATRARFLSSSSAALLPSSAIAGSTSSSSAPLLSPSAIAGSITSSFFVLLPVRALLPSLPPRLVSPPPSGCSCPRLLPPFTLAPVSPSVAWIGLGTAFTPAVT